MMWNALLVENNQFSRFSTDHFIILAVGSAFAIALILWGRRTTEDRQVLFGATLGYIICAAYFVMFISIDAARNGFNPAKHLPLAMCNVCGVLFWLVLHKKNYLAYEILFFWIMSGTLAAVLLPDIKQAFPHYTFFAFWTIHLGLVIAAMYATFVYKMRPTFKSLLKSFAILNVYAVVVGLINGGINLLIKDANANYFYTCQKPISPTPVDWFGEWPWYLLGVQFLALVLFLIIYLPFWVSDFFGGKKEVELSE